MSISRQYRRIDTPAKTDPEAGRHNLIVQRQIEEASYEPIPDAPERKAKVAKNVMKEIAEIIEKPDARKQQVTVRLDLDVLEWLKSGEGHWQSKLNKSLRALMEASRP